MKFSAFLLFVPFYLFAQVSEVDVIPSRPEPAPIQDQPVSIVPEAETVSEEIEILDALYDSIQRREAERKELFQRLQAGVDMAQEQALEARLQELSKDLATMNHTFQTTALHTDISLFVEKPTEEFDWQQKAYEIAEPIFDKLEEMTKDSRELAEIRDGLSLNQERFRVATEAIESLNGLLTAAPPSDLEQKFTSLKTTYQNRRQDAQNQITVFEGQLRQREEADQSMLEQSGQAAKNFIRSLGMDLLLGIGAFCAVFFGMKYLHVAKQKLRPEKKKGRSFSSRLTMLIWTLLSVLLAIGSMLAIFNTRGNIFLVSLTMIFLIGVAWAGMKTLPAFVEQIRMMLNIGAVREDEVLIWENLAWKVNNISFRAELINPRLNGGVITIPTPLLVGMVSRPPGDKEEWFPSEEGDWVVLKDGTFGRISYQTPTSVQVVQLGGSQKVYSTQEYLQQDPMVLSTGFRKEIAFDLDYQHLSDITTSIPSAVEAHLSSVLGEKLGEDLQHVGVQLAEAAESSLRLGIVVDCKGNAAKDWPFISMWVHAAIVDLSAQEGWSIPFPQLQVHTESS